MTILRLLLVVAFTGYAYAQCELDLEDYLQPNEVDRETFLNPEEGGNICARDCDKDPEPKTCYYQWTVENYVTLGHACANCGTNETDCYRTQCIPADGYERGILSINRQYPGPAIEVCLGDRIIVDVKNNMAARTTAIHWHGVFQRGSQYMDGVPMVTQCAIREGTTFRYDFMAENEGTHFYHSHDGLQKLDGIEGNLVIRTKKSYEPNGDLYDYDLPEHKIFLSDWLHLDSDQHLPGLLTHDVAQDADAYLINGYGRTKVNGTSTNTPYAKIKVQSGQRYRMRIVGGLCTVCAAQFSIQGHKIRVIATDGNPVGMTAVDSIIVYSGERYDILVYATQTPGPYWIHVKGLTTCTPARVYGLGILQYEGAENKPLSADPGYEGFQVTNPRILNPENGTCTDADAYHVCTTELVNSYPVPRSITERPANYSFLLTFGFKVFESSDFFEPNVYERYFISPDLDLLTSHMNDISFISPSAPVLSQTKDVGNIVCTSKPDGTPVCPDGSSFCECAHVINIPLGSVVEFLLSDESPRSDLNHPFHLHGYAFYVMYEGQYKANETAKDVYARMKNSATPIKQSQAPAQKDTIAVPSKGYAIVKFKADNPGYWFFHCHFMYHLATGMAVVFKVGEDTDMGTPPDNFPTCSSFMNPVRADTCSKK